MRLNVRPDDTRLDANDPPIDIAKYLANVRKRFQGAALDKAFDDIAKAIDKQSFDKLKRIPGVDASRMIVGGKAALNRYREVNAALITSVPKMVAADVGKFLAGVDVRNLHVSELTAKLEERFGVSQSRAEFWGRDQTLKLYANVNRERQEAAGARRYEWGHSDDERVRGNPGGVWPNGGDHWALGGQIFEWSSPPIVDPRTGKRANPGEDYECRCTAYPVFD